MNDVDLWAIVFPSSACERLEVQSNCHATRTPLDEPTSLPEGT
jgi:hypothetical protein